MTDGAANTSGLGLVIPVDVVSYCVGTVDAHQATVNFAGANTVYLNQTGEKQAFLGANVTRDFSQAPWQPLEQGIHLHWALPDALTRAQTTSGQLVFSPSPNRWLVTRYLIDGKGTPKTKSWVVLSDLLSKSAAAGQRVVTLPVKDVDDQDYRFVGNQQEYDQQWREPKIPSSQTIQALTGNHLTPVASGVVSFAAFYPNCRNVFAFFDTLTDVPAGTINLMYVATGWFSDPANDPLHDGTSLTDLQQSHQWTFADAAPQPRYSLYHGLVQDISWDPDTKYIYEQPLQDPVDATVAIGNNSAEALSAYFRDRNHPSVPLFEKLLNAFQLGLLSGFQQPQPDQLAQLDESLHQKEFSTLPGGGVYTILNRPNEATEQATEAIDLPLRLAHDLNLLNVYQQQSDQCQAHVLNFRWKLFADWYRIFEAADDERNAAFRGAYDRFQKWSGLQKACQAIGKKLASQLKVVKGELGDDLELTKDPAARYWQPNEPVMLLAGDELAPPRRYGGDGQYHDDGHLVGRLTNELVTAVQVDGHDIPASQFSGVALATPNGLPYSSVINQLLEEACLLNTELAAAITGGTAKTLQSALDEALRGAKQTVYTFSGKPPSPVAVNWWDNNPWLPVFAVWTADVHPLQSTAQSSKLEDYPATFFTDNYVVDQNNGGFISYDPSQGQPINPATASFNQTYTGDAVLAASAADGLARQLSDYLADHTDATLQTILDQLGTTNILMQSLSGFQQALLMREQSLQLPVKVPAGSTYAQFSSSVAPVIGDLNTMSPSFNSYFNPIRTGYLKLSLQLVDAFGNKRDVKISKLVIAESMTAYYQQQPQPSIAYLPPRLSQPSRLLFRWIAANSTHLDEMNAHPATSPICGYLLPNHLDGSFFLYNHQGRALGSLFLNGDQSAVLWQSAPGNDKTINQDVQTALQYENPQLRDLAVSLKEGTAEFFHAFWRAVDEVHAFVNPQHSSSDPGMAVLIGRPVALVQASLRLQVQGSPAINESWLTLTTDGYTDTDNKFTGVLFPVILGDLKQINDGLVGYFKQSHDGTGYDLGTFYSDGAQASATAGVVQPSKTNLLLTATPKLDDSNLPNNYAYTQKVLMLVDPRARVHATMGILPTKWIDIPADQYAGTLSTLEMSFLVTPILRGGGGMTLPLPKEGGYQWSWVEEYKKVGGGIEWSVTPDIGSASSRAVWEYTPQQVVGGWIRLNPQLVAFDLENAQGHAVVISGQTNKMQLKITNEKGRSITFNPGQLVPEGDTDKGSIFYMHFAGLVLNDDVPKIQISANGWTFKALNDAKYGNYWAATPAKEAVTLARKAALTMSIELPVHAQTTQAQAYFDYYNVDGVHDGVYADLITVQPPKKE